MIYKLLPFITGILLPVLASSQGMNDTLFNDVIHIRQADVITDGADFLIDIPFTARQTPVVIFNDDHRIPVGLFFDRGTFLKEQREIILITPDWIYYAGIRAMEKSTPGLHLDPLRQNKIYHIKRTDSGYQVDSAVLRMDIPGRPITIHYKKNVLDDHEIRYYYYTSGYNSEQQNALELLCSQLGVSLSNMTLQYTEHRSSVGRPGSESKRSWIYFTLQGLNPEQKLLAIKGITKILYISKQGAEHTPVPSPAIYVPATAAKRF